MARLTNMACHDLCINRPMSTGTRGLMGLGLKYAVLKPFPNNNLNKIIQNVKNTMRRIEYFKLKALKEREGVHYIPGFHMKTKQSK